jgi:CrcB protein
MQDFAPAAPNYTAMTAYQYLLIAVGGAIGALARYAIGTWVLSKTGANFPWGTFVINVTGCFVIGLAYTLIEARFINGQFWRPFLGIGFVGAYTTFSTFEYESAQLSSSFKALCNLVGSVVVGYAAVWIGIQLGHIITSRHIVHS